MGEHFYVKFWRMDWIHIQFPKMVASRKKGDRKEMGPSMAVKGYFTFISKC